MEVILWLVICPIVGLILGSIVNRPFGGLLWGLFLGPVGWIIVLLLPRDESSNQKPSSASTSGAQPPGEPSFERDLSADKYKIYLVKKYSIEKNDALGKIICDDRLFDSTEDALAYADSKDRPEIAPRQQNTATELSDLEKEMRDSHLNSPDRPPMLFIIGFIALVAGFIFVVWMESQGLR
jgi:hypothetical protein